MKVQQVELTRISIGSPISSRVHERGGSYLDSLSYKIKQTIKSQMNQMHSQRKREYLQNADNNFSKSLIKRYQLARKKASIKQSSASMTFIREFDSPIKRKDKPPLNKNQKKCITEEQRSLSTSKKQQTISSKFFIRQMLNKKIRKICGDKSNEKNPQSFSNRSFRKIAQIDNEAQNSFLLNNPFLKIQKKRIGKLRLVPIANDQFFIILSKKSIDQTQKSIIEQKQKFKTQPQQKQKLQKLINLKCLNQELQEQFHTPKSFGLKKSKRVIQSTKFKINNHKFKKKTKQQQENQKQQTESFINSIKNSFEEQYIQPISSFLE